MSVVVEFIVTWFFLAGVCAVSFILAEIIISWEEAK